MARKEFQLNLAELAVEFFGMEGDVDPVATTVINEAI